MRYLSFDMAWKYIQKNPQLMHEVVLEWENAGVQDPAMLGLIARYHDYGGDVEAVLAEYIQSKKRILKTMESKKNHGLRYAAAAVFVGFMALGGWWYRSNQTQVTWTYQDAGIPQFMDERVEAIDWPTINYHFQKREYQSCLDLLEKARILHSENDTVLYYSAYCFLEMQLRDSARVYFSQVPGMGSIYSQRAQYFLFHLNPAGVDKEGLSGLSNVQDPILRQAVQRDIANY